MRPPVTNRLAGSAHRRISTNARKCLVSHISIPTFKNNIAHNSFAKAKVSHHSNTLIQHYGNANGGSNDGINLLLAVVPLFIVHGEDL